MVIPTIDMSAPQATVGRALDAACSSIGFFQIVEHGVDAQLIGDLRAAAADFFALDPAEKAAVAIEAGAAYGYAGFETEALAASRGDETPPDLKETYSIGPFDPPAKIPDDPTAAFVFSATPWPASQPALRATASQYYLAMEDLAGRLLSAMAVGLGLDSDYFSASIDQQTAALRLLHYPDLGGRTAAPGQLRAGAHTDYGTLTLLHQDAAPGGLEVRDRQGEWHRVPAVADAFVVNVGDCLERWTNDRWRSTMHRVVVPPVGNGGSERSSIAFFHNANWDAVVECLPTCHDAATPPRYEPMTAGAHLRSKFVRSQSV